MNEQEIRALVQDTVARVLGPAAHGFPPPPAGRLDTSHLVFTLATGDADGRCLIEPAVMCSHCGYCRSYGH